MGPRDRSSHAAAGISVATIVEAALAVIRQRGVNGLTMRSVAEQLKVRAPSLYHHVRNKDELLDLVARNAFAAFAPARQAYDEVASLDDWIAVTTAGSLRLRAFYADHAGLAQLILAKAIPGRDRGDDNRAELVRAQLQALVRLGVPESTARDIFETAARWSMAAIAAEPTPASAEEAARNDTLFRHGLDLMMLGIRTNLSHEG
ncbi:TetR/AcrR family transcriptional regulator [Kribbella deserti]|uniref:TetR/AcrR family transcriptional regulator n=1 Tax=Kribbella deserti TaxID=1926257 RepID=A0ABV6QP80_9ACTN